MNKSNELKMTLVKAAQAAGTSAVTSDVIDMQGYDGVIFISRIGTANAGNYLKVQQGSLNPISDAVDLAAKKIVAAANDQAVWVDVYRPTDRYLQAVMVRGVSTASGDIFAIRYGGRKRAEVNNITNTIIGELLVSPDELAIS